jgi:hypothetical protein
VSCAIKPTDDEDDARHASRSSGLLQVEASRAKVPNLPQN